MEYVFSSYFIYAHLGSQFYDATLKIRHKTATLKTVHIGATDDESVKMKCLSKLSHLTGANGKFI